MEQPEKISGMFICTSCRDIKCILIQFVESFEKRIIGKNGGCMTYSWKLLFVNGFSIYMIKTRM